MDPSSGPAAGSWPDGPAPSAGTEDRPSALTSFIVLFTGPTVWAVHLAGTAALVPAACSHGLGWAINVLTVVCAVLIAVVTVLSWRLVIRHGPDGPKPDRPIALVAILGLAWGSISLLVTVLEGVPNLVIDACPV